MRTSTGVALVIAIAAAIASPAVLPAQESRPTADSVRPMDTNPSIPVETPTIDLPAGTDEPGSRATTPGLDPNTPVSSQDGPATPPAGAGGDQAATPGGQTGPGAGAAAQAGAEPYVGGVPQRAAPPRTLRAHWHVFVAFAIVWALLFGYALSIGRRFGRLEDEVRRLQDPAA